MMTNKLTYNISVHYIYHLCSLHQKALDFASSIVGGHRCILETTRSTLKFYLKVFSKALPIDIDIKFFAYNLIKPDRHHLMKE